MERLLSMRNSNTNLISVVFILLVVNLIVFGAWFYVREKSLLKDGSDKDEQFSLIRNEKYLIEYISNIYNDKKIIFFGSSESHNNYSIPSQLNYMEPQNNYENISKGWLSPIHLSLIFSKIGKLNISIPPIVLLINPVYFTKTHNRIDEGGLGNVVKSTLFIKMNHNNILADLDKDTKNIFKKYFLHNKLIFPFDYQKYILNLLYLSSRQSNFNWENFSYRDKPYKFNHLIPDYSVDKNTWPRYKPVDEFMKKDWVIINDELSPNMIGLKTIFSTIYKKSIPGLVILLPTNIKYYQHIGLDSLEYSRRDLILRKQIKNMAFSNALTVIDLNDDFRLNLGFKDRMHNDEYGFYQICKYLIDSKNYSEFKNSVAQYYINR